MAKKKHWDVDPWNFTEMWTKLIGKPAPDSMETILQAKEIFQNISGHRCLEIGAGVGRLLLAARNNFYEAWGVDSSAVLVALSTRYLLEAVGESVRVVFNDGRKIPFASDGFDFVYSFTCFQHIEDLEEIRANLEEAYRVLVPGGRICIQTVCGQRGTGRHDGYVFESVPEFCLEFTRLNFNDIVVEQKGEWLWARAQKPNAK